MKSGKKLKPFKPIIKEPCYVDYANRFAIGYDPLQWVLQLGNGHHLYYYGTFEMLLDALAEHELRVYTGNELKAVFNALHAVKRLISKLGREIKLPVRTYGK